MNRFVLKRKLNVDGLAPEQVGDLPGIPVIENFLGKALLVESDTSTLKGHQELLAGWVVSREVSYPVPDLETHEPVDR
jgi:hypothetical protein